jgi:3-hydroxyisobutyrate dehydrogenase-like beta-hydroxyacid dehydrogenase
MGHAMATSQRRAGQDVIVYNRTPEKAQSLAGKGAVVASSMSDACQADAVLTMVSDDAAIESIVFGSGGILQHLAPGRIHISSSTISPDMMQRLASAHAGAGQGPLRATL